MDWRLFRATTRKRAGQTREEDEEEDEDMQSGPRRRCAWWRGNGISDDTDEGGAQPDDPDQHDGYHEIEGNRQEDRPRHSLTASGQLPPAQPLEQAQPVMQQLPEPGQQWQPDGDEGQAAVILPEDLLHGGRAASLPRQDVGGHGAAQAASAVVGTAGTALRAEAAAARGGAQDNSARRLPAVRPWALEATGSHPILARRRVGIELESPSEDEDVDEGAESSDEERAGVMQRVAAPLADRAGRQGRWWRRRAAAARALATWSRAEAAADDGGGSGTGGWLASIPSPSRARVDFSVADVALADAVPSDSVSAVLENADLVKTILRELEVVDLCRVARVSRLWRHVVDDPAFWRSVCLTGRSMTPEQVYRICRRQSGVIEELRLSSLPSDVPFLQRLLPNLSRLRVLELSCSVLSERALAQLSTGVHSLRELLLRDVHFVGAKSGVADATLSHPELTHLTLTECKAGRLTLTCPRLADLSIASTHLSALIATAASLPTLHHLRLASAPRLSEHGFATALTALTTLRSVSLSEVSVNEDLLRGMARSLEHLTSLKLSDCSGVIVMPARGSAAFPALRRLAVLHCDSLMASSVGPLMDGCAALEELVLDGCGGLTALNLGLGALRSVSVRGCRLLSVLELRCRHLEELALGPLEPGSPGCAVLRRVSVASEALRSLSWRHLPCLEDLKLDCPNLTSLHLADCDSLGDGVFAMLTDVQEVTLAPRPAARPVHVAGRAERRGGELFEHLAGAAMEAGDTRPAGPRPGAGASATRSVMSRTVPRPAPLLPGPPAAAAQGSDAPAAGPALAAVPLPGPQDPQPGQPLGGQPPAGHPRRHHQHAQQQQPSPQPLQQEQQQQHPRGSGLEPVSHAAAAEPLQRHPAAAFERLRGDWQGVFGSRAAAPPEPAPAPLEAAAVILEALAVDEERRLPAASSDWLQDARAPADGPRPSGAGPSRPPRLESAIRCVRTRCAPHPGQHLRTLLRESRDAEPSSSGEDEDDESSGLERRRGPAGGASGRDAAAGAGTSRSAQHGMSSADRGCREMGEGAALRQVAASGPVISGPGRPTGSHAPAGRQRLRQQEQQQRAVAVSAVAELRAGPSAAAARHSQRPGREQPRERGLDDLWPDWDDLDLLLEDEPRPPPQPAMPLQQMWPQLEVEPLEEQQQHSQPPPLEQPAPPAPVAARPATVPTAATGPVPQLQLRDVAPAPAAAEPQVVAHPKVGGCPRLQEMKLEGCEALRHARLRHARLASVSLRGCRGLLSLHLSCPVLGGLVLEECGELATVSLAPAGLESLSLGACCALREAELTCRSLRQLSFKGCGSLRHVSLDCPHLAELDATFCGELSDEALASALSCSPAPPPLTSLVLSVCSALGSALLTAVAALTDLRHLDLSYSAVAQLNPVLAACTGLTSLCLGSCRELDGEELLALLPARGNALPLLASLDVSYCNLAPSVVVPLVRDLTRLTHLALNGCSGVDDSLWRNALLPAPSDGPAPAAVLNLAAAPQASALSKLSLVRCSGLRSLCLGLLPSEDQPQQEQQGAAVMMRPEGSTQGGARVFGSSAVLGASGGCVAPWCRASEPLLGPPWRHVECVLSGLQTLRLGLSSVKTVTLSLPNLAHLDLNGCSGLRSLELRCPALKELHLQACCALPADLLVPLLVGLSGAGGGQGLALLDAQHAGPFGEAVAAAVAAAAVMAAAAKAEAGRDLAVAGCSGNGMDGKDGSGRSEQGSAAGSGGVNCGAATMTCEDQLNAAGGSSSAAGSGCHAAGGLVAARGCSAAAADVGASGAGNIAAGAAGSYADNTGAPVAEGTVGPSSDALLAARDTPWWLLPRSGTVLACGADCCVCGRKYRRVTLGLSG